MYTSRRSPSSLVVTLVMCAWGCAEPTARIAEHPPAARSILSPRKPVTPPQPETQPATAQRFPSGARGRRSAGVLTYTSKPWGFDTNSYFLEAPHGLVMIDTQFLPSAAAEAMTWAQAETGLAVVLAIVLHPNPDKFNGTQTLQDRGVRVVTSQAIAELVPAVHEKRSGWFFERYAPDYPSATPTPEVVAGGALKIAGIELKLHRLGPGCSEAHLVVEHGGHIFVGDVVAAGTHAWLELGQVDAWNARLDDLARLRPTHVHPGRGTSGGPELISAQRRYLNTVAKLTARAVERADNRPDPTEGELSSLRNAIVSAYPALDYEVFLKLGLPAVWRHCAAAGGS